MRRNKIILWSSIGGAILFLCSGYFIFNRLLTETKVEYETQKIEKGYFEYIIGTAATVEPPKLLEVKSEISGKIIQLFKDPVTGRVLEVNTRLKKGDIIAVIDPQKSGFKLEELKWKQKSIEYDYKLAVDLLGRNQKLFNEEDPQSRNNVISEREYVESKKRVEKLAADLEEIKKQIAQEEENLKQHYILAPMDGVVIEKEKEIGFVVTAFQDTIVKIASLPEEMVEIVATVNESDVVYLRKGFKCAFQSRSYFNEVFTGEIDYIADVATKQNEVMWYKVKIYYPNKDGLLRYGMTFQPFEIIVPIDNVITVPGAALRFNQQPQENGDYVLVLDKDKNTIKKVGVSLKLSNYKKDIHLVVEEEGGLKVGDDVVLSERKIEVRRSLADIWRSFRGKKDDEIDK